VEDGVAVGVGDGVADDFGVAVGVGVAVGAGVGVGVGAGVAVGVAVGFGVGVGVGFTAKLTDAIENAAATNNNRIEKCGVIFSNVGSVVLERAEAIDSIRFSKLNRVQFVRRKCGISSAYGS
jgi:hypothetical protein